MSTITIRRLLHGATVAVLVFGAGLAVAHDQPGSTEFVAPLPTNYWTGQIVHASLIGPVSGSLVLHATLELTWIADPNMPASDLGIEFGVPTTNGSLHWIVTGADLGWDDGPGPFNATIDTHQLNGEIFWPIPPSSIIDFNLFTASGTGGVWGQFQNSTLTLEIEGEPPAPAGSVPDGAIVPGIPLTVAKGLFGRIVLEWGSSCSGDPDYEIYEGDLGGDFTSHTARFCSTGGLTSKTFAPIESDAYYVVVPSNVFVEGSYGTDSHGVERQQGTSTCLPQSIGICP